MKLVSAVTAAALLLANAGGAQGHTTVIEPARSHFPYQQWADESRMPGPEFPIYVQEGACPEDPRVEGCYVAATATIWSNTEVVPNFPRETFYHELAHSLEPQFGVYDRHRFRASRGHTRIAWKKEGWSLREIFAETYAACAFGPSMAGWFKGTVTPYSPRACELIRRGLTIESSSSEPVPPAGNE